MAEALDMTELVERDVLGVVAPVRWCGVRLAPFHRPPVEDVALLAEPHREAVGDVPGETGKTVDAAGRARSITDRRRPAGVVGERRRLRGTAVVGVTRSSLDRGLDDRCRLRTGAPAEPKHLVLREPSATQRRIRAVGGRAAGQRA